MRFCKQAVRYDSPVYNIHDPFEEGLKGSDVGITNHRETSGTFR